MSTPQHPQDPHPAPEHLRPWMTPEELAEWDELYEFTISQIDYFRQRRLSGADPSLRYRI